MVDRVLELDDWRRDLATDHLVFKVRCSGRPLRRYSLSAADDCKVLEWVRERWTFEMRFAFRRALEELWQRRWDALLPGWTNGALTYRPGDYAIGALAVLMDEPKGKQPCTGLAT